MGRTITPRYFARYRDQGGWHDITWDCARHGRPSTDTAEARRQSLNQSFERGGVNFHVSQAVGYVIHVSRLTIHHNIKGQPIAAEARAPMFEVV